MDRANAKSVQRRTPVNTSTGGGTSSRAQQQSEGGSGVATTTTPGIAAQQMQERASRILANNQLLLRFAVANDLSVPKVRVYFEQLAGGFEPLPIIKRWDVFDD